MKSESEFESSGGAVSTAALITTTPIVAKTEKLPAACLYPRTLEDSTRPLGVETQQIKTIKARGESRVRFVDRCVFSKRAGRADIF